MFVEYLISVLIGIVCILIGISNMKGNMYVDSQKGIVSAAFNYKNVDTNTIMFARLDNLKLTKKAKSACKNRE